MPKPLAGRQLSAVFGRFPRFHDCSNREALREGLIQRTVPDSLVVVLDSDSIRSLGGEGGPKIDLDPIGLAVRSQNSRS